MLRRALFLVRIVAIKGIIANNDNATTKGNSGMEGVGVGVAVVVEVGVGVSF